MMVDTRPTAPVTFKKTLMNQYVQTFINNDS